MDDRNVIERINQLAHEEEELWDREAGGEVSQEDRQRLQSLQVTLDQCWDLLRQRRARRNAGLDPEGAEVRDPDTVEGYLG